MQIKKPLKNESQKYPITTLIKKLTFVIHSLVSRVQLTVEAFIPPVPKSCQFSAVLFMTTITQANVYYSPVMVRWVSKPINYWFFFNFKYRTIDKSILSIVVCYYQWKRFFPLQFHLNLQWYRIWHITLMIIVTNSILLRKTGIVLCNCLVATLSTNAKMSAILACTSS